MNRTITIKYVNNIRATMETMYVSEDLLYTVVSAMISAGIVIASIES